MVVSDAYAPLTSLNVLYEDNHVIAVFKPAGLLTQADASGAECLLERTRAWLKAKYAKPGNAFVGLVHRLDRPVAGVVLFAKTSKGASRLSEQFRGRAVRKIYRALVEGKPAQPSAVLVHYLAGDGQTGVKAYAEPAPDRKQAKLSYHQLPGGMLEIELGTGRKHQIRAQLAAIGCPVVGDRKYGARTAFAAGAIALVAKRLEFDHPVRPGERVAVEVPDELCPLRRRP